MPSDSLFEPLGVVASQAATVDVVFNGEPLRLPAGASVAAALLAGGIRRFRTSPVSGAGRAPYCMMGVCFECLLEIDGVPNRQGCLVPVRAGMQIRSQDSLPDPPADDTDDTDDADDADPPLALAQSMEAHHGR